MTADESPAFPSGGSRRTTRRKWLLFGAAALSSRPVGAQTSPRKGAGNLSEAEPAARRGKIESKRATSEATADTDPNSPFWRGAPGIFLENDARGNPVPRARTEVRSRWTDHNLYFLFTCPYERLNLKPDPTTSAETNELWKWDVAEVFIGSDFRNIRRYREFEISPQGEWVDLDIDLDSPRHEDGWVWNSGFKASSRLDPAAKIWHGFMQIPYASVDTRPARSGNVLRVNFFRTEGTRPDRKALAWLPTRQNTFHVPEAFGSLTLVD